MRPKVANELFSILKLLESEDIESCILGLTMLLEHSLVKNLSKFYKVDLNYDYNPVHRRDSPKHFHDNYEKSREFQRYHVKNVKLKKHIRDIINLGCDLKPENRSEFFCKVELIYIWIIKQVVQHSHRRNYSKEFHNYYRGYDFRKDYYNRPGSESKKRILFGKIHRNDPSIMKSREKFIKGYKKSQSKNLYSTIIKLMNHFNDPFAYSSMCNNKQSILV